MQRKLLLLVSTAFICCIYFNVKSQSITLPAWYGENRVQAHVRFNPFGWHDTHIFRSISNQFDDIGVGAFTRSIKANDFDSAYWCSNSGGRSYLVRNTCGSQNEIDLAQEMIDSAHANGQRLILYYRHMEDLYWATRFPKWKCRDANGQIIRSERGDILCVNSPYRAKLIFRLKELIEKGADGFLFDEYHNPINGCWCYFCKQKFKSWPGSKGDTIKDGVVSRELKNKMTLFYNYSVEKHFSEILDSISAKGKDTVVGIVSAHRMATYAWDRLNTRLIRMSPAVKTEYKKSLEFHGKAIFTTTITGETLNTDSVRDDIRQAVHYMTYRDAGDGRPPHVWVNKLKVNDQVHSIAGALLTYGCIANMNHEDVSANETLFDGVYDLDKSVSPSLATAKPYKWVGVLLSESSRDSFLHTKPIPTPQGWKEFWSYQKRAWEKILYPAYFAVEALTKNKVPFNIVVDEQLFNNELGAYKVLLIPDDIELTAKVRAKINAFVRGGGKIIEVTSDMLSFSKSSYYTGINNRWIKLGKLIAAIEAKAGEPPFKVFSGSSGSYVDPSDIHVGYYAPSNKAYTVAMLSNNFTWCANWDDWDSTTARPDLVKGRKILIIADTKPASAIELVSNTYLPVHSLGGDSFYVNVPDFQFYSAVRINKGLSKWDQEEKAGMSTLKIFPNPTAGNVQISYSLFEDASVSVTLYDITGKEIAAIVGDKQESGFYNYSFDTSNVKPGMYFVRLRANEKVYNDKLIISKE